MYRTFAKRFCGAALTSAAIAATYPHRSFDVQRLQLFDTNMKLCSQSDFDRYFERSGISDFYILAVTGPVASGKSTLINELFFEGQNVMPATGERQKLNQHITEGINAVLVSAPAWIDVADDPFQSDTGTILAPRVRYHGLLVLDCEGLFGSGYQLIAESWLLRTLALAHGVLVNVHAQPDANNLKPIAKMLKALEFQFDPKPSTMLVQHPLTILFYNRQPTKPLATKRSEILELMDDDDGAKIANVRFEVDATYEKGPIVNQASQFVGDLSRLKKFIAKDVQDSGHTQNAATLWSHLKYLNDNMPTKEELLVLARDHSEKSTQCPQTCQICHRQCMFVSLKVHSQHDALEECSHGVDTSIEKKTAELCQQCLVSHRGAHVKLKKSWFGWYECPQRHGNVGHHWWLWCSGKLSEKVHPYKEHVFGWTHDKSKSASGPTKK